MTALIKHGMLLQSAHGPLPNVAEMIAGEPIRGSWWNHPASRSIFDALNLLAESPDVVRMRLVNGKVTLVHRRLWPALDHVAFGVADRNELQRWEKRLDKIGVSHGGVKDAGYGSGLSFRDPDGLPLEFFAPPA